MSNIKQSEITVSQKLAKAIVQLHAALNTEAGSDFSYTISVRGHKVAASNMVDGLISPKVSVPKPSGLTPLQIAARREKRIAKGLQTIAARYGVILRTPLTINSNGEFNIVASNGTEQDGPSDPCGRYNGFAAILSQYSPRCGMVPTKYLSPANGWCYMNHFDAERLVKEKK